MEKACRWPREVISLLVVCMLSLGPFAQGVDVEQARGIQPSLEAVEEYPLVEDRPDPQELLSNIDGFFTENRGQKGEGAGLFYCQGSSLSVAFGTSSVMYDYQPEGSSEGVIFRITFEGANTVSPTGFDQLTHNNNYFIGNDPKGWVTGVNNYREVMFPSLYEDIDLRFHFGTGILKYEYMVGPGANPSSIVQVYDGIEDLSIDKRSGNLEIRTPVGTLVDTAPLVYQPDEEGLSHVVSRFDILEGGRVSIVLGEYDPRFPLIIDPGMVFSTYVGGSLTDEDPNGFVDHESNVYIGSYTSSKDFPTTLGSYDPQYSGRSYEGVLFKLDKDGSKLVYSTYLGGSTDDYFQDIHVSLNGTMIAVGTTFSADFPTTSSAYQKLSNGGGEGFILMLNPSGSKLIYSTFFGGSSSDGISYLALTADDKIIVSGSTQSNDFPVTAGCYCNTYPGGRYSQWIAKFDKTATSLLAATYFGGSGREWGLGSLVLDTDGKIYVTGTTQSTDLPTSSKSFMASYQGGARDGYLMRFTSSLTSLDFCTYIGGSGFDGCQDSILSDNGSIIMVGRTDSTDFPCTLDAQDRNLSGVKDVFMTVLDGNGEGLVYSTYIGGGGGEGAANIGYYQNDRLVLLISSTSPNLSISPNAYDYTHNGGNDIYIGLYNRSYYNQTYGSYLGGSEGDTPSFIQSGLGNITIAGHTFSNDYPTSLAAYSDTRSGEEDIVVSRIYIEPINGTVPSAPENLKVEQGNRTAILSWEPPIETSDLPIIVYKVFKGSSEDNLTLLTPLGSSNRKFEDHLVLTGRTYHYSVSALTFVGEGNLSQVVNVTVVGPPRPPEVFEAFPGNANVTLTWRPPRDTGALPVLGYVIKRGSGKYDHRRIAEIGDVTTWIDEDVENGQEYYYSILAINSFAEGEPTTYVVSVVPFGLPTEPRYLMITAGDSQLTLEWRPPQNDGGRSILGYRICRGLNEASLEHILTVADMPTTFVDTFLTNGVTYHYSVLAFNDLGDGPFSAIVSGTPMSLPGTPLDLLAEPLEGKVALSWEPPESDGGTEVLGYIIYRGPGGDHLTHLVEIASPTTSYMDTDVVNGQTYYYAVCAMTSEGCGPSTPFVKARPMAPPDAPSDLAVMGTLHWVELVWIPPVNDGGADVEEYVIYRGPTIYELERYTNISASTPSFKDLDITVGTTYHYAVSAVTVAGEGPMSDPVSATPYGVPGVPQNLEAIADLGEVALFWDPPVDDGASLITGYVIMRGLSKESMRLMVESGPITSYLDTSVVTGATYNYAIAAKNLAGTGDLTEMVSVMIVEPDTVPSRVVRMDAEVDGATVTLTWTAPVDDGGRPITGYSILRGLTKDSMEQVAVVGPGVTTWTDEDLERGTTYYYSVAALNDVGASEPIMAREIKIPDKKQNDESPGFEALAVLISLLMATTIVLRRRR